jgi:menaquinone-dependent protoporphyrinogen oxidase
MKVLVSAASRYGGTAGIAQAIGDVLSSQGIEADVRRPEEVQTVTPYDGVIIGSGVYAGHWLEPAKTLIERESAALATRPVWLFSSGPLADSAKPGDGPVDVRALRDRTGAIDHRVFSGRLDRSQLGLVEKAIFKLFRAPEGDFRSWDAVTEWASGIARTLKEATPLEVPG